MSSVEKDVYRDTFLRYFGYSHHLGTYTVKNFHYVYSGITASYIFADLMQKVNKAVEPKEIPKKSMWKKHKAILVLPKEDQESKFVTESIDVLLWQGLASVLFPSLIAGNVSRLVSNALSTKCSWRRYRKPISSASALFAIFAASYIVDSMTTELLNYTYRPLIKFKFNDEEAKSDSKSEKKEPPK